MHDSQLSNQTPNNTPNSFQPFSAPNDMLNGFPQNNNTGGKNHSIILLSGIVGAVLLVVILCVFVIPFGGRSLFNRIFGDASTSSDGATVIVVDESGLPDLGEKYIALAPYSDGLVAAERVSDQATVFLDTAGREVFELDTSAYALSGNRFYNGRLSITCQDADGYSGYGFLGISGELAIGCQYSSVDQFVDGYAQVIRILPTGEYDNDGQEYINASSGVIDIYGNYTEQSSARVLMSDLLPL